MILAGILLKTSSYLHTHCTSLNQQFFCYSDTLWCRLFLMGCCVWAGIRKSEGTMRVPEWNTVECISDTSDQWIHSTRGGANDDRSVTFTLMDELVEGVLPIGSWLSPHDRPSVVVYTFPVISDVFPIWLHVTLGNKRLSELCVNITISFSLVSLSEEP